MKNKNEIIALFNSEKFSELKDNTDIIENFINDDLPGVDIEELQDKLQDSVNCAEIIYYHNAIKYLQENDPSLMESLALAKDCGYTMENINSELLATLLLQQELTQQLSLFIMDCEKLENTQEQE